MPTVADGTPVRFVDVAAPWLGDAGGDETGERVRPVAVARVRLRYDETKADLVHDEEFECVLPLDDRVDVTRRIQVDYDERDLRSEPNGSPLYELPEVKIQNKTFWRELARDLRDHLTRSLAVEIRTNEALGLYGRPGEGAAEFAARCRRAADDGADEAVAALRDKYESRARKLRDRIEAAEDRLDVVEEQASARRNSEMLSTAGSVLGGLLGGRKSLGGLLGQAGTAARRRGSSRASAERVEAAENKVARLVDEAEELEQELADDVEAVAAEWDERADDVGTMTVGLEKTDVDVAELVLAWLPVR
jgi:hypothetical protein